MGATIDPDSNVSPYTGKARKRYRITVAVLSSIVVLSYILMGLFKVFTKFLSTMNQTGSMVGSFEAAADELDLNETKLAKATKGSIRYVSKINETMKNTRTSIRNKFNVIKKC